MVKGEFVLLPDDSFTSHCDDLNSHIDALFSVFITRTKFVQNFRLQATNIAGNVAKLAL